MVSCRMYALTSAILDALPVLSTLSKDVINVEIDSLQQKLARLNALYSQNASSLPAYEQRKYQQVILCSTGLTVATKRSLRTIDN